MDEADFLLHKVVSSIRLRTNINNLSSEDLVDEEFYFKTPELIMRDWKNLSEAIDNTYKIANECNVDLKLNEYKFPVYSIPSGTSADSFLWNESFKGLEKRFVLVTEQAKKRLKMELSVINEMGFSNYFLIVWEKGNGHYWKRLSC